MSHMIVPGGGISLDGERWVACRPGFLLPVRVLSRLFRRRFLEGLAKAHAAGRLKFFSDQIGLADPQTFAKHLAPLGKKNWFVYAKPPFAGPPCPCCGGRMIIIKTFRRNAHARAPPPASSSSGARTP